MIRLSTIVGTRKGRICQVKGNYITMDVPSAYNIIIGRPLLNSIRATLSTYKLKIQYLTGNGSTKRIAVDKKTVREGYIAILKTTIPHSEYEVGKAQRPIKNKPISK